MKYRELLKLYEDGKLEEETRKKIEEEIEKQEAISDYLYEREQIPELEEMFENESGDLEKNDENRQEQFAEMLNRSIRRAFYKLGAAVLAIVLVLVLLVQYVLPQAISSFYYNPLKENADGNNQMSLDMAVYSELLLPGKRRTSVAARAKGYGSYEFDIRQTLSYTRMFTTVSGEITRNQMRLYNEDLLKRPTGNCFAWAQVFGDLTKTLSELEEEMNTATEQYLFSAAGTPEEAKETANHLKENEKYIGYVSLETLMDYESFIAWLDETEELSGEIWCAVQTEPFGSWSSGEQVFRAENLGFLYHAAESTSFSWDEEAYPELLTWNYRNSGAEEVRQEKNDGEEENDGNTKKEKEENKKDEQRTESYMKQHMTSLLRYMADQDEFLEMMEYNDGEYLRSAADYIEENGLHVYGFAAVMEKESIQKMMENPEVYVVYSEMLQ